MSDVQPDTEPMAEQETMEAPEASMLPLSKEDLGKWKRRIEQSKKLLEKVQPDMEEAVQAYLGKPLTNAPTRDTIIVNKTYAFVEQKKAELAFQVPEVQLKPKWPGLEGAVSVFQAALNHKMGPDGANVKATIDECLFDVLTCGIACEKIGYQAVVGEKEVMQDQPVMDPMTGVPMVDPMTMQPVMQPVPVTMPYLVHEEYFRRRLSPDKLLLPIEFEGEEFDRAPWLAMKFDKDLETAKREYSLPENFSGKKRDDFKTLSGEKESVSSDAASDLVEGIEIWYRAAMYDSTELHPERVRCLVLIDGHDEPVKHEDSPYQEMNAQGKLIGLMGFPLNPLTLRVVAGSAYPPSDVSISKPVEDELSKGRTQMLQQRDDARPVRGFDKNRIDPDTAEKLKTGAMDAGAWVPMDGPLADAVWEVARTQFPRENFTFDQIGNRDYEELWAIGPNQRGMAEDSTRTATELNIVQNKSGVRLDAERSRVLTWFIKGTRKFASLLQMFADETEFVEVVGPQMAPQLQPWNRQLIAGEYVFDAKPDSALRIDAAAERQQCLQLYNLLARDPNVSRIELLKALLMRFNMDPTRLVVPEPPKPGPEKPKVSISVTPAEIGLPHVIALLEQYGIKVTPEMAQQSQGQAMVQQVAGEGNPTGPAANTQPHGGAAPQAEPLSKHGMRNDGIDARTSPGGGMM